MNHKAEAYGLEKLYTGIAGKAIHVIPILPPENELGYTSKDSTIHISFAHPIMDCLSDIEKVFFRKGVFVHETMHQVFTDFEEYERYLGSLSKAEGKIFSTIFNILEDPSIEYWAPTVIGGPPLDSLRFSIYQIYKQSPNIEEAKDALSQFFCSLIQFGDMGLLKGYFTEAEAQKYFMKVAPIFAKGIEQPECKARLMCAYEIMQIIKPLWKDYAEKLEELQKLIDKLMENAMKSVAEGTGTGKKASSSGKDESSTKKRRTKVINGIEDGSFGTSDKDDKSGKDGKTPSGDKPEDVEDSDKENDFGHHDTGDSVTKIAKNKSSDEDSSSANYGEIIDEEYEISEEDIKAIEDEMQRITKEYEDMSSSTAEDESSLDRFEIGGTASGKSCLNYRIKNCDRLAENYATAKSIFSPIIKTLTTQLKRIFENDYSEKEYKSSGRINITRMNSGKVTSRLFDKNRDKKDKDDMAVMILIDESGSMSGYGKYMAARNSAIVLSEVFGNLNIPIYIMGFTADTKGFDVVHNHYITWKNTKMDRFKLMNISARANNCDGYSIRYASKVLNKRNAAHKLFVILSDGQPACSCYPSAIADTKQAIREAKKNASVLGVAIGNSDTDTIYEMYGKDFLHVNNVNDLSMSLCKAIRKVIMNW